MSCPQVQANAQVDFVKGEEPYLEAKEDNDGILHADAEDDLLMVQEQLRRFNDVNIGSQKQRRQTEF